MKIGEPITATRMGVGIKMLLKGSLSLISNRLSYFQQEQLIPNSVFNF